MSYEYVYADCAATCPILPCAFDAVEEAITLDYGNPNSTHTTGREARDELEWARETIARCINAEPEQIAFTPSATAACHTGLAYLNITECSPHEHKAVSETVNWNRLIAIGDSHSTAHILANNETGERYDSIVCDLAKNNTVLTDATAAVGQVSVDVKRLGVAALAAGAHMFGGYPGIGFLYLRDGVTDEAAFPGTPPVALAVAMARALGYRCEYMVGANAYLMGQTDRLAESIFEIPGAHINSPMHKRLPNILSVRFDYIDARELLAMLDMNGVCASAGAACRSGDSEPSPVLLASGLTEEQALSTIRLSFCPEHTPDEFNFVAEAVRRSVSKLRNSTK